MSVLSDIVAKFRTGSPNIAAAFDEVERRLVLLETPGAPPPPPPPSSGVRFALGSAGDMTRSATVGQSLGVKHMRTYDHGPSRTVSEVQASVQIYQSRGIRPVLLCNWGNTDNLAAILPGQVPAWAKAVGPGGTLYTSRPELAGLAVEWIEMGNEWFYNYRGGSGTARAQAYALAFKATAVAVRAANPRCKLVFMLDIDNQGTDPWNALVDSFYQAVPNLHDYIDAYSIHLYGPPTTSTVQKLLTLLARMESHGAPTTIPVMCTEDGISSDNGRALTSNYGWPTNMTYAQAGAGLRDKFRWLREHPVFGARLALWTNYQAFDQKPTGTTSDREHYFGVVQANGTSAKGDLTQSVRDHAKAFV